MREQNIEVARAAIEAFNRGDTASIQKLAAPDFEVRSSQELPNPGNFRGFDGYEQWVGAWLEAWDEFHVEELETEAIDEHHVLMLVRQVGTGQSSGLEITMDAAYLYEVGDDSKLVRFELHLTRESALGAVRRT
jgi:ketosteroid isomerase-like protein